MCYPRNENKDHKNRIPVQLQFLCLLFRTKTLLARLLVERCPRVTFEDFLFVCNFKTFAGGKYDSNTALRRD